MRKYFGINALSSFKTKKLIKNLQKTQPEIYDLSAEFAHFVDFYHDPQKSEENELISLLSYGEPYRGDRTGEQIIVIPRQGTISPWSSKATNIASTSGLKNVRRIERGVIYYIASKNSIDKKNILSLLYDRMTEEIIEDINQASKLFEIKNPKPLSKIDILQGGLKKLESANLELGLALNDQEIKYLYDAYKKIKRNPTDAELIMFAQINSEHCRHKIFNADWEIDGKNQPKSLFKMIKNTYEKNSQGVISAYTDNAAILEGPEVDRFYPDVKTNQYKKNQQTANLVIKAETHNHPTAIAPGPGAATGVGGEIRDEAATGRGAKSKAGFTGYSVSGLNIPGFKQPWENPQGKPERISSALDIMLKAPIGGAAFANEFGRPNLAGYFRTFEQEYQDTVWGYHKPLMIAGGLGNIDNSQAEKLKLKPGDLIIVLGGPSMLIGLGGSASSSMQSGQSDEELDFASVQRANAEMQRRAQEVISQCASKGSLNPIKSIHDVGAGGLSNAIPEIVEDNDLGASIELRNIPNVEPGLSPMEIWCNESQERFVLAIDEKDLDEFSTISERERCIFAVVGKTTKVCQLKVYDKHFDNHPIDMPMDVLFGNPPKLTKKSSNIKSQSSDKLRSNIKMDEAVKNVLQMPSVGSKKFLITIGDRTVGGMSVRDQMVGPWQVPVSDVAVTSNSFFSNSGEALSVGERTPIAVANAPASGRMAVGEAITNIAAAKINKLSDIKLSANWMAASGFGEEDKKLFDTVKAVGEELCPELGITIPVGKDSLSMRTTWNDSGKDKSITSPVSLIISAFTPLSDTRRTLTPMLHKHGSTKLIYIDLAAGKNRLGFSALAQSYGEAGSAPPDLEDPAKLKSFFDVIQELNNKQLIKAYHDRSDGGLITVLLEMAFAGRSGLQIDLSGIPGTPLEILFNEELGAVIELDENKLSEVTALLKSADQTFHTIGHPTKKQTITFSREGDIIYQNSRAVLEGWWTETSYQIQKIRDNERSANEEFSLIKDTEDPGINPRLTFSQTMEIKTHESRPKVAILREQGINGQTEMAVAFWKAGFDSIDVHMEDLISGKVSLKNYKGIAACGGFSYGDVLGGGGGWAKSILFNQNLKEEFRTFFERSDTFSLGVCNGCQMLSQLKNLVPGADTWPKFLKNESEQFEARLVSVEVGDSPSILFKNMENSILPVPTAHGEGRAVFDSPEDQAKAVAKNLISLRYVDNYGRPTSTYPLNPNGSIDGITALTTPDGRSTIVMPHPERSFLTKQLSWHPEEWAEDSPWMKMFRNAREWVG